MKYYAAYGSNLNKYMMSERCPDAEAIGTAVLQDFELSCRGVPGRSYLTIDEKEGSYVPLGIFRINEEDEAALDQYEDYPALYEKRIADLPVTFWDRSEETLPVLYYVMNPGFEKNECTSAYALACLNGYDDFGFDSEILMKGLYN